MPLSQPPWGYSRSAAVGISLDSPDTVVYPELFCAERVTLKGPQLGHAEVITVASGPM